MYLTLSKKACCSAARLGESRGGTPRLRKLGSQADPGLASYIS